MIKLLAEVMPSFEHHTGIAHGISEESYGGDHALLGETRQGSVFSRSARRDVSCVIFKELERKRVGIVTQSKNNEHKEHRVAIACIDNADFCAVRVEWERNMQEIVKFSHCNA